MRLRFHQLREEVRIRNSKGRRDTVTSRPEVPDCLGPLEVPEVNRLPRVTEQEPGGLEVGGHGLLDFDDVVRKGRKPIANRHGFRRRDRRRAVSLVVAGNAGRAGSRTRAYGGRIGGGESSGGSGGGGSRGPGSRGVRSRQFATSTAATAAAANPPARSAVSREKPPSFGGGGPFAGRTVMPIVKLLSTMSVSAGVTLRMSICNR